MSVNKVIILGRLGQAPELKYLPDGKAVCNFSLATSESWTDKAGAKQEKTEWHKVVVWGKLAELSNQYLAKGKQAYIEGRMQTRSWDDKDGTKKYTTEILANTVQFIGGQSQPGHTDGDNAAANDNANQYNGTHSSDFGSDDVPF